MNKALQPISVTHAPMRTPWPLAGHAAGPWIRPGRLPTKAGQPDRAWDGLMRCALITDHATTDPQGIWRIAPCNYCVIGIRGDLIETSFVCQFPRTMVQDFP